MRWADEALRDAVQRSRNAAECLDLLGIVPAGGNYDTLRRRLARSEISTAHWVGQVRRSAAVVERRTRPLDDILRRGSGYVCRRTLKRRLIAAGLLDERCATCGTIEWNGQRLALHLDHIDGDGANWELSNLRLLCPNCHSLTPTYCGRSKGKTLRRLVRENPPGWWNRYTRRA
jgi:5-methylcytosine-specific restriction endonuclease McrA